MFLNSALIQANSGMKNYRQRTVTLHYSYFMSYMAVNCAKFEKNLDSTFYSRELPQDIKLVVDIVNL